MTIKIYKRGTSYTVNLPEGVTLTVINGDLEKLKTKALYAYRIFDGSAKFEIVEE